MPNWKIGQRSAVRRSAPFVEANILSVRRRTARTARREQTIVEHLVLGGRGYREDPGAAVVDLANGWEQFRCLLPPKPARRNLQRRGSLGHYRSMDRCLRR